MKKFITLLMTAMAVSGAFAQSADTEEARRILSGGSSRNTYPSNDGRVYDNRGNYPTSKSGNVDAVNRDYDAKINSIRNNRNLSNAEKDRIIRDLERQRQRRIQEIRGNNDRRYDDRRNDDRRYDKDKRRYDRNDKNYGKKNKQKGNNGKHLGWQKGKGNPHRYD
jgi:hypothetical protein